MALAVLFWISSNMATVNEPNFLPIMDFLFDRFICLRNCFIRLKNTLQRNVRFWTSMLQTWCACLLYLFVFINPWQTLDCLVSKLTGIWQLPIQRNIDWQVTTCWPQFAEYSSIILLYNDTSCKRDLALCLSQTVYPTLPYGNGFVLNLF
jgi:hypothetical protein